MRKLTKQESQLSGQPHPGKTAQLSIMVTWQWGLMVWGCGGHLDLRESPEVGSCICYLSTSLLVWLHYSVYLHLASWVHLYHQLTDSLNYSSALQIQLLQAITILCRWALLGSNSLPWTNWLWPPWIWKKCCRRGLGGARLLTFVLSIILPKDLMI